MATNTIKPTIIGDMNVTYNNENVTWNEIQAKKIKPEFCKYGFKDVKIWDTEKQRWVNLADNPEKFIVQDETFEKAKQAFWRRWANFCFRRFGHYVRIGTLDQNAW